jgi:hypothetical protein
VGHQAGEQDQKQYCVAIGYQAGSNNQEEYAIAIGAEAGNIGQPTKSIVINATGGSLVPTAPGQFHVAPIRKNIGPHQLYYDDVTGEITWG